MVCHPLPRYLEGKGNFCLLHALQTNRDRIGARRKPRKIHANIERIDPARLCFIGLSKRAAEFIDPLRIVNRHTPIQTARHNRIRARAFA